MLHALAHNFIFVFIFYVIGFLFNYISVCLFLKTQQLFVELLKPVNLGAYAERRGSIHTLGITNFYFIYIYLWVSMYVYRL